MFFFLIIRRPPRSTRTDTLVPYPTLCRSPGASAVPGPGEAAYRLPASCRPSGRRWRRTDAADPGAAAAWAAREAQQNSIPAVRSFPIPRSEEHTSELQSLMRISYAFFCLQKKITCKHDYNECHYIII